MFLVMASKPKKAKKTKTTQKTDEAETRQFLEAVGWFVIMFSITEQRIQDTLWHFTKVDPIIGRCIFSNIRIDEALRQLKRIAEAQLIGQRTASICSMT